MYNNDGNFEDYRPKRKIKKKGEGEAAFVVDRSGREHRNKKREKTADELWQEGHEEIEYR